MSFANNSADNTVIEAFLDHIKNQRRLSEYTCRNYLHAIKMFFEWFSQENNTNNSFSDVDRNVVRSYIIEIQKSVSKIRGKQQ